MSKLKYTPDSDLKVHEEGAIRLICAPFQAHESGLPEWAKNAADEYVRRGVSEENRAIVLIFNDTTKSTPGSISCLDFSGMTSEVIETRFRVWADPEASRRGAPAQDIQGGHGNGGKCYMTQMFADHSMLHTVYDRKGCKYGVSGGSIKFGYFPNRDTGRDYVVQDVAKELGSAIQHTGVSFRGLPSEASKALLVSTGFTLVTGVRPKHYKTKIPVEQLVDSLLEHPQMVQTIRICKVYVVHNGKLKNGGKPLVLPEIEPMPGAETPREIAIPEELKDPVSGEKCSTTGEGQLSVGKLILKTSKTSMRWSKKLRHSIAFMARSGYVGYVEVGELDIQSPFRDRIYGECQLDSIEQFKQNIRGRLAEAPLTRALERFIASEIQKYAQEFEVKERQKHSQKEKNEISRINEALDKWKNKFLSDVLKGQMGDQNGTGSDAPPQPFPVGTPTRIELTVTNPRLGRGVSIRPTLKFFDENNNRIRPVPFHWISEDTNIALVDEDLHVINAFSYGHTLIYAETLEGRLRSNRVTVEVVPIVKIRIVPDRIEVPVGGRAKLQALCTLRDGSEVNDVSLIWQENTPEIARVSPAGQVFAFGVGQTQVTVGDDGVQAETPGVITVTEASNQGDGNKNGKGLPRVFVSGEVDSDPDTGEYVHFSAGDPPVWQRAEDFDRNIWWINSTAPLAKLYLDKNKGYGYQTREWRIYHLERYIDVIVQIALTSGAQDAGKLTAQEWVLNWGQRVSEIQAAAASDLTDFITDGKLPEDA